MSQITDMTSVTGWMAMYGEKRIWIHPLINTTILKLNNLIAVKFSVDVDVSQKTFLLVSPVPQLLCMCLLSSGQTSHNAMKISFGVT